VLRPDDAVLQLLMRIRDEAHRRATGYHKHLRRKDFLGSPIEGIPGIGPLRRRRLHERFGDLSAVAAAGPEELASVRGMSGAAALAVYRFFHPPQGADPASETN
jgi:excinuclease ABC subunit C